MNKKLILSFVFLIFGLSFVSAIYEIDEYVYSNQFLSVSAQETDPEGAVFNDDGSSFYIIGYTSDRINQYDCTTPYDFSTCSYASKFLSVTTQDTIPRGLASNNDGSSFYISGDTSNTLYQYDCTTAYDVSTCSYASKSLLVSGQSSSPYELVWDNSGDKIFIIDATTATIYQYGCTTSFDISTCSYASKSLSVSSEETTPRGLAINNDGSSFYATGDSTFYQYDCTTPNDISTCSYASKSLSVSGQDTSTRSLGFSSDGEYFITAGRTNDRVYLYKIPTLIDNLELYYSFDSTNVSGNTIIDLAGNYNGTNSVGSSTNSAVINEAWNLQGTTEYISLNPTISSTTDKSISVWFNITTLAGGYLLDSQTGRFIITPYYPANLGGSPNVGFFDGSTWHNTGFEATLNQYHHLVLVNDVSANIMSVYIDGTYITNITSADISLGTATRIGSRYDGTSDNYRGNIDEFGIWTRALSSTEVTQLYNSGAGLQYPFATPTAVIGEAFNEILFNDETIVNNSNSNLKDNYWYLKLNETLGLQNLSVNFNGSGWVKYWDLPITNNTNLSSLFASNEIGGLAYYDDKYYIVDTLASNDNLIILNKDGSNNQTKDVSSLVVGSTDLKNIVFVENKPYLYFSDSNQQNYLVETNFNFDTNLRTINIGSLNINYSQFLFYDEIKEYLYMINIGTGYRNLIELDNFSINNIYSLDTSYLYSSMTRFNDSYYFMDSLQLRKFNLSFSHQSLEKNFFSSGDCSSAAGVSIANTGGVLSMSCLRTFSFYPYLYKFGFDTYSGINYSIAFYNAWNLSDGNYTIQFRAENDTIVYNSTLFSFSVDSTKPTITNTLPSEYNYYEGFNISNYVSCSDNIALSSCNITFSLDGSNVAVTTTNYNFTYNGNQSYTITAIDSFGNTQTESGVILINPYAYFSFNNSGTLLQNFSFGGVTFTNTEYANFTLYGSTINGLGNKTFEWSKFGYITQNITFEVTNTSNINTTYNVSPSVITVNIYDKNNLSLITGVNFTLIFVASVGLTTSTTTGTINISNLLFQNEQYALIVSNTNYNTETVYFDFTNEEGISVSVYMLEKNFSNLGYVTINVKNNIGQDISGAIVQALQWNPSTSTYEKVSESKTSEDGDGILNIILDNKYYIFRAYTTNSNAVNSTAQIITTAQNGKTIFLVLEDVVTEVQGLLQGVSINVTESFSEVTNQSNVTFTWLNIYGGDLTGCIKVYRSGITGNRTEVSSTCSSPSSSATITKSYTLVGDYNYIITAEFLLSDGSYIEVDSFVHYSNLHISELITEFGLQYFILVLAFVVAVWIMVEHSVVIGSFVLMAFSGVGLIIVPSIMNKTILGFVMFISIAIVLSTIKGGER